MVQHQCPRENFQGSIFDKPGQSLDERVPIVIVEKDIASLDASADHMVERADGIKPWTPRHGYNPAPRLDQLGR